MLETVAEQEALIAAIMDEPRSAPLVVHDQDSSTLDRALCRNNTQLGRAERIMKEKDGRLSQQATELAATKAELTASLSDQRSNMLKAEQALREASGNADVLLQREAKISELERLVGEQRAAVVELERSVASQAMSSQQIGHLESRVAQRDEQILGLEQHLIEARSMIQQLEQAAGRMSVHDVVIHMSICSMVRKMGGRR